LLLYQLLVASGVQQLADLATVRWLDADHPSLAEGILVHLLRGVDEGVVALDDLAGDRREELAHRLGGLDHAERLSRLDLVAHLGQLHVDHVAELVLGEGGDADGQVALAILHPLMVLRVLQLLGKLQLRHVSASSVGLRPTSCRTVSR
jgi:hypothetical protein